MKTTLLLATTLLVAAGTADAAPRFDHRQDRQAERIARGVETGTLTYGETNRLVNQQVAIHRTERRFEADGLVTPGEQVRLENRQDRASASIRRQKHDRAYRRW